MKIPDTTKIKSKYPKGFADSLDAKRLIEENHDEIREKLEIKAFNNEYLNNANAQPNVAIDATRKDPWEDQNREIAERAYVASYGYGTKSGSTKAPIKTESTSKIIISDENVQDSLHMDDQMIKLSSQNDIGNATLEGFDGSITSLIESCYRMISDKSSNFGQYESVIGENPPLQKFNEKTTKSRIYSIAKDFESENIRRLLGGDYPSVINLSAKRITNKILDANEYILEDNSRLQRIPYLDKHAFNLSSDVINSIDSFNLGLKRAKSHLITIIAKTSGNPNCLKFEFFDDVFNDHSKKYDLIKTLTFELRGSLNKEPTALRDADRNVRFEAIRIVNNHKMQSFKDHMQPRDIKHQTSFKTRD